MAFIGDCGKRPNCVVKPPHWAEYESTGRLSDFSLINKGLVLVSEANCCWQEGKRKFVWDIAANNPQFFPQKSTIRAHIYFQTLLTIRGVGGSAKLHRKKGPEKGALCTSRTMAFSEWQAAWEPAWPKRRPGLPAGSAEEERQT
jgi:hypothetical protein